MSEEERKGSGNPLKVISLKVRLIAGRSYKRTKKTIKKALEAGPHI